MSKKAFIAGYMAAVNDFRAVNREASRRFTAAELNVWHDNYDGSVKYVKDADTYIEFIFEVYNGGNDWSVCRYDPITGRYRLDGGTANGVDDAKRCCDEWIDEHLTVV